MTSARAAPHDALIHWIGIADLGSRLEYSINPSAETEAIDAIYPVVFQGESVKRQNHAGRD